MNLTIAVAALMALVLGVQGSHFRGGTINWKSEGGTKVHFYFRLGWRYGTGPGCTPERRGMFVQGTATENWECQSNNCGSNILSDTNYYCTGANQAQDWEQGSNDFTYSFPSNGQYAFKVGFAGHAWILLANSKGGDDWNLATTIDLRVRSDLGVPNSSPETLSKPIYYVPFQEEVNLKLPVIDPNNDRIRCRWARGNECESVCSALPHAYLDEDTCTLEFNTTSANNYVKSGVYAVALMIEDYPKTSMTLSGSQNASMTHNDVLSSVPLQFLVQTVESSGTNATGSGPRFVPPTPEEGKVMTYEVGETATIDLYADNGYDTSAKANDIHFSGPLNMTQSPVTLLTPVTSVTPETDVYTATLTWKPTAKDEGNHIVCASVTNDRALVGAQRCFTVEVVPRGCKASPCQNDARCVSNNYKCVCRPGFTGYDCDVNIDDCENNTCPEGTHCVDGINTYTCVKSTSPPCTCK